MATRTIKSVDVRSFTKSTAVICFVIGLIGGFPIFVITSLLSVLFDVVPIGLVTGFLALVVYPLVFLIIGFVFAVLFAVLYNFLAGLIGGVKVELR